MTSDSLVELHTLYPLSHIKYPSSLAWYPFIIFLALPAILSSYCIQCWLLHSPCNQSLLLTQQIHRTEGYSSEPNRFSAFTKITDRKNYETKIYTNILQFCKGHRCSLRSSKFSHQHKMTGRDLNCSKQRRSLLYIILL